MDDLTPGEIVDALTVIRLHGCNCQPTFERMSPISTLIRVTHTAACAITIATLDKTTDEEDET